MIFSQKKKKKKNLMNRKLTPHTIHVNELCDIAKGPALPNPKANNLLNFMLMARAVFDKARFVIAKAAAG